MHAPRYVKNMQSRMKAAAFVWLFLYLSSYGRCATLTESEPNNDIASANPISCGDTVLCAQLAPPNDIDHFRFWAAITDSIVVFTVPCSGSQTNTLMVLYDPQDSIIAVNDDGGEGYYSMIQCVAAVSGEYTVRVILNNPTTDSTYSLGVICPAYEPENYDHCDAPRSVGAFPYSDSGTTLGMTNDCGTAAPDVFYKLHNPAESDLLITVCSDHFDARVQIMDGCCSGFGDDASEGCNLGAVLPLYDLPEGYYSLLVEGTAAGESGNFTLEVTAQLPDCPPPGPVVLMTIGGLPFLDWPEVSGPSYYVVWQCNSVDGEYEHLATTFLTYYQDSTGYVGSRRFYHVTSVCLW